MKQNEDYEYDELYLCETIVKRLIMSVSLGRGSGRWKMMNSLFISMHEIKNEGVACSKIENEWKEIGLSYWNWEDI